MAKLLVVHHTPSPSMHSMLESVLAGARDPRIEGVEVVVHPALGAATPDVLEADGYLLGTPANLGYMSGALKHFFDLIYYPCLDGTRGRPYGVYIHGNNDTDGALTAIQRIVTGLQWRQATLPVQVIGEPDRKALDNCWELGATVAASLTLDER
jgi:multimeric flavodoxin WrbA